MIGLLAALAPAMAHAQTNIDQGKTPAQIFTEACSACHKAARGLANGKGSYALTEFLHEHYTTSRDQAAALAAYVLGAGSGPKPPIERPAAAVGEPKTNNRQTRKPEEASPPAGAKEPPPPASAKLQPPAVEEPKPHDAGIAVEEPGRAGRQPADKRRETRPPVTATRGHRKEPEAPFPATEPGEDAREPAPATREPAAADATTHGSEMPGQETSPTPSGAVSTDSTSGDNAPVPRDNIPD
ncbi:MAG: hypothetical protein WBF03_11950 [Xanthobacteraceae bacterium]